MIKHGSERAPSVGAASVVPPTAQERTAQELRTHLRSLASRSLDLERRNHDLQQGALMRTDLIAPFEDQADRIGALEAELSRLRGLLSLSDRRIAELVADVAELDAHLNFARYENEAIRNSNSMKVGQAISRWSRPVVNGRRRLSRAPKPVFMQPPPSRFQSDGSVLEESPTQDAWTFSPGRPIRAADPAIRALSTEMAGALDSGDSAKALQEILAHKRGVHHSSTPPDGRLRSALLEAETACLIQGIRKSAVADRFARTGSQVVVDVRCLQDPRFQDRGIGRHAATVLKELASSYSKDMLVALVTENEDGPLPEEFSDLFGRVITRTTTEDRVTTSMVVCLSPMTASVEPLAALLADPGLTSRVVIFDFIPLEWPDRYLNDDVEALRYRARLLALQQYDYGLAISEATAKRTCDVLSWSRDRVCVTGVADTLGSAAALKIDRPFVFAPSGGDSRKNLPSALRGFAALKADPAHADLALVVSGNLGPDYREAVRVLTEQLALDAADIRLLHHVSEGELAAYFSQALAVIVPSFAEGFSMPVAEAVTRGTPVVASHIPEHEELLGSGPWLVPPTDSAGFGRALATVLHRSHEVAAEQFRAVGDRAFEPAVRERIGKALVVQRAIGTRVRSRRVREERFRLAILSPMTPQPSGISDYTAFTASAMAVHADVVVYSEAVHTETRIAGLAVRPLSAEPYLTGAFDAVLTVLGNSSFHIPMLEYLERFGGSALAHDDRMIELYAWWRGTPYTADLMSAAGRHVTTHDVDRAMDHLDEACNLGFGQIAVSADRLLVHSRELATRVAEETGRLPAFVPFVPYRLPEGVPDSGARTHARRLLGLVDGTKHLVSFGEVDIRTKGVDRVVAALGWLHRWGESVQLHFVGSVDPTLRCQLEDFAHSSGVGGKITFHERVEESVWRNWLLAADAAVQLRTSEVLTISGALADCIAFGLPTATSGSLGDEMDAPSYVTRVARGSSPLVVAEAIKAALVSGATGAVENERLAYLRQRSADAYARAVVRVLQGRFEDQR